MAKRPNIQPFTWLLLALVVLLFAGLLGVLLADSRSQAALAAEADSTAAEDTSSIPCETTVIKSDRGAGGGDCPGKGAARGGAVRFGDSV